MKNMPDFIRGDLKRRAHLHIQDALRHLRDFHVRSRSLDMSTPERIKADLTTIEWSARINMALDCLLALP